MTTEATQSGCICTQKGKNVKQNTKANDLWINSKLIRAKRGIIAKLLF